MSKLYELLAVEGDLKGEFLKIVEETKTTFTKRSDHFSGHHKRLEMRDEDRKFEEASAEQHKHLDDTVGSKIDYTWRSVERYFDAVLQKETANQSACADLVLDGKVIKSNLPATFLLALESRLKDLRNVYAAIPTLPPGIEWESDAQAGEGIFKAAKPEVKAKTETRTEPKIVVEPTEKHPAQWMEQSQTTIVGNFITERKSGMLTPAHKSRLLGRIDTLIREVKKSRQRANSVETNNDRVGKALYDWIHEK